MILVAHLVFNMDFFSHVNVPKTRNSLLIRCKEQKSRPDTSSVNKNIIFSCKKPHVPPEYGTSGVFHRSKFPFRKNKKNGECTLHIQQSFCNERLRALTRHDSDD